MGSSPMLVALSFLVSEALLGDYEEPNVFDISKSYICKTCVEMLVVGSTQVNEVGRLTCERP